MDEIIARWLIIAGIFLAGELLIRTYFMLDLSAGAMIGAVVSHLEFPFLVQWVIFVFASLILFVFTREIKKEID